MTLMEMKPARSGILGPVCMVGAGAFFAAANTLVQMAGMTHGVPAPTIAFWQYAIATLFAMPLLFRTTWRSAHIVWHVVRVMLAVIGVQAWVAGLAVVPIWQAIALILTSPLFVTLGAVVFLGERLTLPRLMAVLIGAAGGVIILAPWTDGFTQAAFLPVLAALFWAGSSVVTKRLAQVDDAGVLTVYLLALIVPFNAVAALGTGFTVSGAGAAIVIAAGLVTAVAQFLLARAYRLSDAAYLQPFDHLKLPLNVALGLVVFGYAPPGAMWLGAALMIGASGWLLRQEADGPKPPAEV